MNKKERNHLNVLLLALSIFPNRKILDMNTYRYDGKIYSGRYQLEPVPKVLADKLRAQGEELDMIIMLCTKDVLKEEEIVLKVTAGTNETDTSLRTSPIEFFKDQIREWTNPDRSDKETFVPVNISEETPSQGLNDLVDIIRNLGQVKLYLDNHGGYRGLALTAEALISLLKNENLQTRDIYGVFFDPTRKEENRIIDDSASFRMFDFVSGINEFINYGRSESLEKYIGTEEELVQIIRDIAEGIQLCDISKFEMSLDRMTEYVNNERKSENSYLAIFEDNMKANYKGLLRKNRSVVDELRWCLEKGFLQQALTLIEARMPQELAETHVIEFSRELLEYAEENCAPYEKHVYILNRTVPGAVNNSYQGKGIDKAEIERRKLSIISDKEHQQQFQEEIGELKSKKINKFFKSLVFSEIDKKTQAFEKEKRVITVTSKNRAAAYQFFCLHAALRQLRNKMNHADTKPLPVSVAQVKMAIRAYIELAEQLEQECRIIEEV